MQNILFYLLCWAYTSKLELLDNVSRSILMRLVNISWYIWTSYILNLGLNLLLISSFKPITFVVYIMWTFEYTLFSISNCSISKPGLDFVKISCEITFFIQYILATCRLHWEARKEPEQEVLGGTSHSVTAEVLDMFSNPWGLDQSQVACWKKVYFFPSTKVKSKQKLSILRESF